MQRVILIRYSEIITLMSASRNGNGKDANGQTSQWIRERYMELKAYETWVDSR